MSPGKTIFAILSLLVFIQGCMEDDLLWDWGEPEIPMHTRGVFIVSEGNFMYGNASLSYYDPLTKQVFNDVFFQNNALPLGDVAHSMTIRDSLGYVVVNNSGRIYIIHTSTFELKGKITGLTSPRYMHFISDDKAYVSDLYARSIAVVNPQTGEVTGSIPVNNFNNESYQHATEQLLQYDRFVYTNCWSYDNQVLVIDSKLDRVIDSIQVLKQPNSMVLDKYHSLWVLCDGGNEGSSYGHETAGLMRIEAGSANADLILSFADRDLPRDLKINGTGDTLYYINGHVYRYAINGYSGPEILVESPYGESVFNGFYGLDVDPESSELYVADAIDFVQRGRVFRFSPEGIPVDTFLTGIAPGSFCFNF